MEIILAIINKQIQQQDFSIIKYAGTQAAGTIPHGLGTKPDWMIFKNRDRRW